MNKKSFLNLLPITMVAMSCIGLTSCGDWYYCTVSGFGSTPLEKTYYIEPIDQNLINDLEFREYAGILRNRLNETGYKESSLETAALCIRLGYYIGEKELVGTHTSSGGFSTTNGKIVANTKTNANGWATNNIYGNRVSTNAKANGTSSTAINTQQSTNTYNYSNTSAVYSQDIGCYIEAISTSDMKPIWTVEVLDHINNNYSNGTFRKVMPWMLASAQTYFGKSGEGVVKITKKEGIEQKGLIWPY